MSLQRLSETDAASEIMARRVARNSLLSFTEYTLPSFESGEHHKKIADALEKVERGEIKRLMIFAPPRHTKSELASRRFPAYYLGKNPNRQIICTTYSHEFAADFGRDVRNIVASDEYRNLFETTLREDSKSANRWHTTQNGVYVSTGIGGALTGRGGDIILIDDPLKNRDEADSELIREKIWKWYTSTLYTRLMPGGSIILVLCMTGDTPVLMADGSLKLLADIRKGDRIATYDNGTLSRSTVVNHINNGPDSCYKIKTISGRIIKANARHPFLIYTENGPEWVRLSELQPGQYLYRVKGSKKAFLKVKNAKKLIVTKMRSVAGFVTRITTKSDGRKVLDRRRVSRTQLAESAQNSNTDTVLHGATTKLYSKSKKVFARFAKKHQRTQKARTIGTAYCASIIATTRGKFEGCCVTIATYWCRSTARLKCFAGRPATSDFTLDAIESIEPCGVEDVYDIQVDKTENFIANGYVSHNTRWHEDDLAGRLLEQEKQGGDKWEVINLRAIENEGTRNEKALWPQWYDLNALHAIKKAIGHRDWISLYQQEPKPIEGTLIKREWFKRHYHDETPKRLNAYITSDFATDPNGGDFTEFGVWGIDEDFNVWALDWWYDQESPDVWIEKLLDLADEHKPLCVFGESGVIRRSIDPFLTKRMQKRKVFFRKEWITRTTNKVTSLRGFQGLAASGKINIPLCDWGDRLINQLCEFPAAKHDDAVDVCSLLGMALDDQHEAIAPAGPTQPKRDSWGRAKRRSDSWRV